MDVKNAVLVGATVLVVAVTARLGWWQLDRAAERQALHDALQTRMALPALSESELATQLSQAEGQHFRRVSLVGRWQLAHTVFLDNRVQAGRNGLLVVTPLVLADGSAVVVLRGWVAHDPRQRSSVPRLAALGPDPVRVEGRVVPPPSRHFEMAADTPGPIRQNLDLESFAKQVDRPLRPLAIQLADGPWAAGDGLQRLWPPPAPPAQKNLGYAFQWFALAALTAGLYVWFRILRPRRAAA